MTNKEKYKKELLDIFCSMHTPALKNGKLVSCNRIHCAECEWFSQDDCKRMFLKWLKEECVNSPTDWSNISTDAKILVSKDGKNWKKQHFLKYSDGVVYTFWNGQTSWTSNGSTVMMWKHAKFKEE